MPPETETDAQLLERFLAGADKDALAELFGRYANVVYAAAMRQVRRADLAADVTQSVFIVLTHKAATLRGRATVGGWLVKVTRYAAIDAMRKQSRQRRHEQAAAKSEASPAIDQASAEWEQLSQVIDESLAKLSETERDAIVMRFFKDQSFKQIGLTLGISEEAARKRVARSVLRLKAIITARGVGIPAAAIGPMLLQNGVTVVPTNVLVALTAPATGQSAAIANGVLRMIAWTHAKLLTGIVTVAVLLLGGGVMVQQSAQNAQKPPTPPAAPPVAREDAAELVPALTGAAAIYDQAARLIVVECPTASTLEYPGFPPMGDAWTRLAAEADVQNKPARDLMRQARAFDKAEWPIGTASGDFDYLSQLRSLAIEAADSALYLHLAHGRDAEAIAAAEDVMHLASLLRGPQNGDGLVRMLVATGSDALACYRLMTIAPGLTLAETSDGKTVATADLRKLINQLLAYTPAERQIADAITAEPKLDQQPADVQPMLESIRNAALARPTIAVNRVNAERAMTAISLACQLYRFENGRWPARLDDLIPAYLPKAPIDPFGDGKQTIGYALIKAGLPDGTDRPLVYTRAESKDGLSFRTDGPKYEWSPGDGTDRPVAQQKQGGQFRDVARWAPTARPPNAPTTQKLD